MPRWLAGCLASERASEQAVNRIPSRIIPADPPLRLPPPVFPLHPAHRGILLGQTRSQAWLPFCPSPSRRFSGRRTTGSALCGGISMGLHKPEKSLGQRRVLLRYENASASLTRSLSGLDNTSIEVCTQDAVRNNDRRLQGMTRFYRNSQATFPLDVPTTRYYVYELFDNYFTSVLISKFETVVANVRR